MTIIKLTISLTSSGLKIKQTSFAISKVNTKTFELLKDSGEPFRVKKSKVGTNNSIMRQDLIGAMYFATWVFPEDVEATIRATVAAQRKELQERWQKTVSMIEHVEVHFNTPA